MAAVQDIRHSSFKMNFRVQVSQQGVTGRFAADLILDQADGLLRGTGQHNRWRALRQKDDSRALQVAGLLLERHELLEKWRNGVLIDRNRFDVLTGHLARDGIFLYTSTRLAESLPGDGDITDGDPVRGTSGKRPGIIGRGEIPSVAAAGVVAGTMYIAAADGTERVLAHRVLELVDDEGRVTMTTRSEPDGFYLFEKVMPGTYTLQVSPDDQKGVEAAGNLAVPLSIEPDGTILTGIDIILLDSNESAMPEKKAISEPYPLPVPEEVVFQPPDHPVVKGPVQEAIPVVQPTEDGPPHLAEWDKNQVEEVPAHSSVSTVERNHNNRTGVLRPVLEYSDHGDSEPVASGNGPIRFNAPIDTSRLRPVRRINPFFDTSGGVVPGLRKPAGTDDGNGKQNSSRNCGFQVIG